MPMRSTQLFLGAFSLVVGLIVLLWPRQTVVFVAVLFGLQLLVQGVVRLVQAIGWPAEGTDGSAAARWVPALLGVLSLAVGLLCLRRPVQTVVAVTLLMGLFWLVEGLVDVIHAIGHGLRFGLLELLGGIVGAVAGVVLLAWPEPSAVILALVFGLWLILVGSLMVLRGLRPRAEVAATA